MVLSIKIPETFGSLLVEPGLMLGLYKDQPAPLAKQVVQVLQV